MKATHLGTHLHQSTNFSQGGIFPLTAVPANSAGRLF